MHSKSPNDKEKIDKLFDKFRHEWGQINNMNNRTTWMSHAMKELGSNELFVQFYRRCSKYYDELQAPEEKEYERQSN